jgi:hypothetical protein
MFIEGFNPAPAMASDRCPRCASVGLAPIQEETYSDTPAKDRHVANVISDPSVYAQCAACGLVMEWPGCRSD